MNIQHRHNKGFAVLGLLLVSVIVVAIAATGWVVWSTSSGGKTSQTTLKDSAMPKTPSPVVVRITLVESKTKQPLQNLDFEFVSEENIQCVSEPCPTGEMRYAARSNSEGRIEVPLGYVKEKNTVVGSGYTSGDLKISVGVTEYTLPMLRLRP